MTVDILLFPLDSIKTRLQSTQGLTSLRGVYSGMSSVVVGSAPSGAIFFTTYEHLKRTLPLQGTSLHLSAAIVAELVRILSLHLCVKSQLIPDNIQAACLVRVPTEVIKSISQTTKHTPYTILRSIYSTHGLQGFYRGFNSTLAREIPFTAIQFPLYEHFKYTLSSNPQPWQSALCGSLAGAIAAGITTPLDVVKTRIMLSTTLSSPASPIAPSATPSPTATPTEPLRPTRTKFYPTSFPKALAIIYREEGVNALFSGVVPRVMWISIGGAVFFGAYETAKKLIGPDQAELELQRRREDWERSRASA